MFFSSAVVMYDVFLYVQIIFWECIGKFKVSRRTGNMDQRKNEFLNPHVPSFIRDFIEYGWRREQDTAHEEDSRSETIKKVLDIL